MSFTGFKKGKVHSITAGLVSREPESAKALCNEPEGSEAEYVQ